MPAAAQAAGNPEVPARGPAPAAEAQAPQAAAPNSAHPAAPPAAPRPAGPAEHRESAVALSHAAPAWPAAAADLLRALGRLPGVRGWAVVGAEGAVVAADSALRAGLIASDGELTGVAASVADRVGFGTWRTLEMRGPAGSVQVVAGPAGWSLLALLGPEADRARVREEGGRILSSLSGEEPAAPDEE